LHHLRPAIATFDLEDDEELAVISPMLDTPTSRRGRGVLARDARLDAAVG
jgi:hypothetical protein